MVKLSTFNRLQFFYVPKPSNTCKAVREMFLDFKTAGEFGILLSRSNGGGEDDTYIRSQGIQLRDGG